MIGIVNSLDGLAITVCAGSLQEENDLEMLTAVQFRGDTKSQCYGLSALLVL